ERVRALRRGQPAHPPERRQVEPGVVLLRRLDVPVAERADTFQIEWLEDGIEPLLGAVAIGVRLLRLGIDIEAAPPEEPAKGMQTQGEVERRSSSRRARRG